VRAGGAVLESEVVSALILERALDSERLELEVYPEALR
jgi:hypothetical protein